MAGHWRLPFGIRLFSTLMLSLLLCLASLPGGFTSVSSQSGTSDIAIITTNSGSPFYDACYVLLNHSNEGCDANRDGQITFEDIPYGTYTLRQTSALSGGRTVADTSITVSGAADGDGWERFYVSISATAPAATSDIAIVTLDGGNPFYDACFVLVDHSQVGCDVNRDGKITFEDIPHGSYTLRQTNTLLGGKSLPDSTIYVTGAASSDGWERFTVNVVNAAPAAAPVDIALITRDPADGKLLTGTCYVLVDHSNEGCDENGDGQVTFAQIPPGTYTVRQTKTPDGYPTTSEFDIVVPEGQTLDLGFVVRQAEVQNAPDTRNVSIVFVDTVSNRRFPINDLCAQLVNGSNLGCDSDLRDGQIDFLDVPAGEYLLDISGPTSCQWYAPQSQGELRITVDASAGQYTTQSYFVYLTPACEGSGNTNTQGQPLSPPSSSAEERANMQIGARGLNGHVSGVVFTVALQDGTYLGTCTFTPANTQAPYPQGCEVNVPRFTTVIVTLDQSTLPAGTAVVENPLSFDTSTHPGAASYWGIAFQIVETGQSGPAPIDQSYDAMIGDWIGKRRYVTINSDGTGELRFNQDAFGNGLVYQLSIDTTSQPPIATITSAEYYGGIDPAIYPPVGWTFTLQFVQYPTEVVLELHLQEDTWEIMVCSPDSPAPVSMCY